MSSTYFFLKLADMVLREEVIDVPFDEPVPLELCWSTTCQPTETFIALHVLSIRRKQIQESFVKRCLFYLTLFSDCVFHIKWTVYAEILHIFCYSENAFDNLHL